MGKFVKDQKVVALTLEGLAPCTVVRVGWIFIMVQVEETKHLYSLTKGKITSIEEDKHYLLEESFDEEGVFDIGRVLVRLKQQTWNLQRNHLKKMKTSRNTKIFTIHQKGNCMMESTILQSKQVKSY